MEPMAQILQVIGISFDTPIFKNEKEGGGIIILLQKLQARQERDSNRQRKRSNKL